MAQPSAELHFRASPIARLVAVLLIPTAAVFIIWAIIVNGPVGMLAVVPFGIVVLVAWAALHVGVTASPSGLRIDRAFKRKVLQWRDVEGFWFRDQRVDGGLYALVATEGLEQLPLAASITPGRPNRRQAAAIREGLTSYLRATRSNAPQIDEEAVGAVRFPAWKVAEEAGAGQAWEFSYAIRGIAFGALLLFLGLQSAAAGWSPWWASPLAPLGLVALAFSLRKLKRFKGHARHRG